MSKFFLPSISLLILTGTLTGCAINGPANHDELCNKLRSEIIYNNIDHNISATNTTRWQKEALINKSEQNNCGI